MRIRIEIDGVAVSAKLDSFSIDKELNGRTSKAAFKLMVNPLVGIYDQSLYDEALYQTPEAGSYDGSTYDVSLYDAAATLPSQQSTVVIFDADTETKLFRGVVVHIGRQQKTPTFQWWDIVCSGFEYLLENSSITRAWTGKTVRYILQDAFGAILPSVLTTNSTVTLVGDVINYESKDQTLRDLVEALAGLAGADWRVTEDSALSFYASGSAAAPFGVSDSPDLTTTYRLRAISSSRETMQFANKVTILGGYYGTSAAELRGVAQNADSIAAIGLREAIIPARDIKTQAAVDLAAGIQLDTRSGVNEVVEFTADHGSPKAANNVPTGLDVGQLLPITSHAHGTVGSYVIQAMHLSMQSGQWSTIKFKCGDYRASLAERNRRLEKIKNGPVDLPAVPPPPNSIVDAMVHDIDFSKVENVTIDNSMITSIDFAKVTSVLITNTQIGALAVHDSNINDVAFGKVTSVVITNSHIVSLDFSKVTSVAVSSSQITSLDFAKVTSVAVTSSQIVSLDFAKVTSVSITDSHIVNVDFSKITGTIIITGSQIDNLTITDGNLANNTISSAKIASLDVGKLTGTTITASLRLTSGGPFICDDVATFNSGLSCLGDLNLTGALDMTGHAVSGVTTIQAVTVQGGSYKDSGGNTVIDSLGVFVGANGINVGSAGVGCGGVNPSGNTGQTVTITGIFGPYTSLVFVGGVLVNYS